MAGHDDGPVRGPGKLCAGTNGRLNQTLAALGAEITGQPGDVLAGFRAPKTNTAATPVMSSP